MLNEDFYMKNLLRMGDLLIQMNEHLIKTMKGNKAATQRLRTETILFEKTAKLFRKLSIWKANEAKEEKNKSKAEAKELEEKAKSERKLPRPRK